MLQEPSRIITWKWLFSGVSLNWPFKLQVLSQCVHVEGDNILSDNNFNPVTLIIIVKPRKDPDQGIRMSAYGDIKRIIPSTRLPPTIWNSQSSRISDSPGWHISVHPLTLTTARALPGFVEYLGAIFSKEIEDGMTYPQEGDMRQETFEAYFFSADVFVGILGSLSRTAISGSEQQGMEIEEERAGRTWDDCVVGYYYIKPNYPGRSSHICNAGFVVPPLQRGKGYGKLLAQSYLYYAPRLGYQASVFNLVYVNNAASIKLWENLGFTKAGRIPRAGRLRIRDGEGEEYIDAWVFYKNFLET